MALTTQSLSLSVSAPPCSTSSSSFKAIPRSLFPLTSRRAVHKTGPPPTIHSADATQPEALVRIQRSGIIACLRAQSAELAVEAARAALTAGISVLEITMTTPGALEAVKDLSLEFSRKTTTLGVGTVVSAADAREAVRAGAKLLTSPATAGVMEILTDHLLLRHQQYCSSDGSVRDGDGDDDSDGDVLYIPGAMTPTEVLAAYNSGAKVVKIYPISVLGGVDYLSVLKKPFPHIPMIASQGVGIDSIEAYVSRGASAVVLSDAIFERDAMRRRDFGGIHQRARLAAFRGRQAVLLHNIHRPAAGDPTSEE